MSGQDRTVLVSEALRFAFDSRDGSALEFAPMTLFRGDRLLVFGPSGSGKSTLLSLLAGVRVAQRGRVELLGRDWGGMSATQRDRWRADHIGFIFQQFNLLDWLSALENVLLPTRFSALRAERARANAPSVEAAASDLLVMLDIPQALWRLPAGKLSVGQQQRVAAARALIGSPELILADEPTSALDERLRDRFMDGLIACCRQAGSALLLVSHDRSLSPRFDHQLELAAAARPEIA